MEDYKYFLFKCRFGLIFFIFFISCREDKAHKISEKRIEVSTVSDSLYEGSIKSDNVISTSPEKSTESCIKVFLNYEKTVNQIIKGEISDNSLLYFSKDPHFLSCKETNYTKYLELQELLNAALLSDEY